MVRVGPIEDRRAGSEVEFKAASEAWNWAALRQGRDHSRSWPVAVVCIWVRSRPAPVGQGKEPTHSSTDGSSRSATETADVGWDGARRAPASGHDSKMPDEYPSTGALLHGLSPEGNLASSEDN